MSGRSGYRKTDRRQSRARPLLERLHEHNGRLARRFPSSWVPDVRICFLLPRTLDAFVASGNHDHGVVVHRGVVQITNTSAERCFEAAQKFLAAVARQRPAFTVTVSVMAMGNPVAGRWLTVVGGNIVLSSGYREPRVYEARAA